jgi:hypothetical protein
LCKGKKARPEILAFFVSDRMNNGKITAYEFYRRVGNGRDHFVGTLPERRRDPVRINEDSILNWARLLFSRISEDEFRRDIYFLEVKI